MWIQRPEGTVACYDLNSGTYEDKTTEEWTLIQDDETPIVPVYCAKCNPNVPIPKLSTIISENVAAVYAAGVCCTFTKDPMRFNKNTNVPKDLSEAYVQKYTQPFSVRNTMVQISPGVLKHEHGEDIGTIVCYWHVHLETTVALCALATLDNSVRAAVCADAYKDIPRVAFSLGTQNVGFNEMIMECSLVVQPARLGCFGALRGKKDILRYITEDIGFGTSASPLTLAAFTKALSGESEEDLREHLDALTTTVAALIEHINVCHTRFKYKGENTALDSYIVESELLFQKIREAASDRPKQETLAATFIPEEVPIRDTDPVESDIEMACAGSCQQPSQQQQQQLQVTLPQQAHPQQHQTQSTPKTHPTYSQPMYSGSYLPYGPWTGPLPPQQAYETFQRYMDGIANGSLQMPQQNHSHMWPSAPPTYTHSVPQPQPPPPVPQTDVGALIDAKLAASFGLEEEKKKEEPGALLKNFLRDAIKKTVANMVVPSVTEDVSVDIVPQRKRPREEDDHETVERFKRFLGAEHGGGSTKVTPVTQPTKSGDELADQLKTFGAELEAIKMMLTRTSPSETSLQIDVQPVEPAPTVAQPPPSETTAPPEVLVASMSSTSTSPVTATMQKQSLMGLMNLLKK